MSCPSGLPLRLAASLLVIGGCLAPLACGGGTPHPKDEGDNASSSSSSDDSSPASSAAAPSGTSTPAPAASSAAASGGPAPAATPDSSGDIKAASGDDPWLAAHQMPPADVMRTMKGNAKVQACWKAGLKRDPSTTGEVKIRLVIANDGKVRAWRDDGSSMSDEEVTQCVGGVVEKLKFPKQKSPGDAWGVYSIHFGG
jgi:hypothetical protein